MARSARRKDRAQSRIVLDMAGPRSVLLVRQAYAEEGLECPDIDEAKTPASLLYPRSFVEAVSAMPGEKTHDYCFIGGLYRSDTFSNREWILDFARRNFTDASYFLVTDGENVHTQLGPFDHTNLEHDIFVPKEVPPADRAFFHDHYFAVMRHSKFTLCPAGDLPWSMRFFEAIMCRSIPIVSDLAHAGRNDVERAIGYRVYRRDDEHVYDEDIVEDNLRSFVRHQTLMAPSQK